MPIRETTNRINKINEPKTKAELQNMLTRHLSNNEEKSESENIVAFNPDNNLKFGDTLNNLEEMVINVKEFMGENMENIDAFKQNELNNLHMKNIYNKEIQKNDTANNDVLKKESVNKRLFDFYSKDYDFKSTIKQYFKYIYYILIVVLLLILIYKKLHKNKKILAFLMLLILIPIFLLNKLFDLIMNNIGHFKLDILYSFLLILTVGVSYGGFLLVKKIMNIITKSNTNQNNIIPPIMKDSGKETPANETPANETPAKDTE